MPIKPENKALYPDNWETEIRPAILQRAAHKCEWCGVPNYTLFWNHPHEDCWHVTTQDSRVAYRWYGEQYLAERKQVTLTIAHVHDPNPANCNPDNLAALCNACHNRHDTKMRVMNKVRSKNAELEAAGQLRLL